MSTLDQALLEEIQYLVVEPPSGGTVWPSGLWTFEEVREYASQRQNRLLKDTHLLIGEAAIPVTAGTSRIDLPADWIVTTRVLWQTPAGDRYSLQRGDSFEADHLRLTWETTAGDPILYMDHEAPTLVLQLAPVPIADGVLIVQYVGQAPAITGEGEILAVPDLHVPVVKWGTIADMLGKVGRAHDPIRSQYAQVRFQLGVEATRILLQGWG